jgi:transcriptional regulator with XRE-family HTH domain
VLERLPNGTPTADGALRQTWPHREVWEGPETCALDVADRGTHTLLEIGLVTNLTREGVRRIEQAALGKLRDALGDQAEEILAALAPDVPRPASPAPTFARRVDEDDDADLDLEVIDLTSERAALIASELGATRCPGCGALHMRLARYCGDACAAASWQRARRAAAAEIRRRVEIRALEASEVLGDQIRLARLRRKISTSEAAAVAGVTPSTWSNWERGHRTPATWQASAVAHALSAPALADRILAATSHPIERRAARRGWSMRELSRRAGIARDTLSAAVRGRRAPSTTTLRKLEEALGAEISGE